MMPKALTLLALVSVIAFPWPFTVLIVLVTVPFEPFAPLVVGVVTDVFYYPQHAGMPIFTGLGALTTVSILLVRSRLKTGIIGE